MNLANLLQSIGALPVEGPPTIAPEEDTIVASGMAPQTPVPMPMSTPYAEPMAARAATPMQPPSMDNLAYLLEAERAKQYIDENGPKRKGMFGVKGTLRDVLGLLGDSFLVQSGNKALYGPRRQQEQMADAMMGASADPEAAFERMIYGGFGEEADKMYNSAVNRNALQTQRATQADAEARQQLAAEQKQLFDYAERFGQYAGSIKDAETYNRTGRALLQMLKDKGRLPDEFVVPEKFEDFAREMYQFGEMKTSQQINSNYREKALGQKESQFVRAEAGRMARDNPPAGRAPPRPESASEYEARIRNKIGKGTATQAEIESITIGKKRSSGGRNSERRSVTPPGTFKGWSSKPRP